MDAANRKARERPGTLKDFNILLFLTYDLHQHSNSEVNGYVERNSSVVIRTFNSCLVLRLPNDLFQD